MNPLIIVVIVIIIIVVFAFVGYFVIYKTYCKYNNFSRWMKFNFNKYEQGFAELRNKISALKTDNNLSIERKNEVDNFGSLINGVSTLVDMGNRLNGNIRRTNYQNQPKPINMKDELRDILKTIKVNSKLTPEERKTKQKLVETCLDQLNEIILVTEKYRYPLGADNKIDETTRENNNNKFDRYLDDLNNIEKQILYELV